LSFFSDDDLVVEVFFIYIVRCRDGMPYIGMTEDVASRVAAHTDGAGSIFTAARRPVVLVYSEPHSTRIEAVRRERQLKRWTRAKKEALIAADRTLLKRL
jgi:predicted GIY-YIG superfamily endonuclease